MRDILFKQSLIFNLSGFPHYPALGGEKRLSANEPGGLHDGASSPLGQHDLFMITASFQHNASLALLCNMSIMYIGRCQLRAGCSGTDSPDGWISGMIK